MQCPNKDGELIAHTAVAGENNLTVSYSTCPTCGGHWMEAFAANFIKLSRPLTPERSDGGRAPVSPVCPICNKQLDRETGEQVPEGVTVYRCPDNHGYFFPTGQLAAFKKAQSAKINYFKIWNLPLPSVASVLLAGLVVLVLAGGGYVAFTNLQTKQTITTQAQNVLTSHAARVNAQTKSVLISATTNTDADITVNIPLMNNFVEPMKTTDRRTHTLLITNVSPGPHTYFLMIAAAGSVTQSDVFDFTMPAR